LLKEQIAPLTKDQVEVLVSEDDGAMAIGDKRNLLVHSARGHFLCFVDDDDMVATDYVAQLLKVIGENPDIDYVGWRLQYFESGILCSTPVIHSLRFEEWRDTSSCYERDVSHLNPVRASLAKQVPFPKGCRYAEDRAWGKAIKPLLKKEAFLDRVMYFYYHDAATSCSQSLRTIQLNSERSKAVSPTVFVDLISAPWCHCVQTA
jgi:hypothetical protein